MSGDVVASDQTSRFYIESLVAFQERRPRSLKNGHTFAVFDPHGDVVPSPASPDGIYHRDTRHLSRLELRLNDAPLLLLSSNVQDDNIVLSVHLTNPDLGPEDDKRLRGERIHINRRRYLSPNCCHERLLIHNFDGRPQRLALTLDFAADFADLFEVRGQKRARRGHQTVERGSGASISLRYFGLDGCERTTTLRFAPPPLRLDPGRAEFQLSLAPGEATRIIIEIDCGQSPVDGDIFRRFYSTLRLTRRAMRTASARAAAIESSNSLFNELARRSVADLYMLLTDTPHGPYPFAGIPWFSTVFGRDAIITALFALWVDPEIAKGVLRFLAAHQATETDPASDAEPGKILHEMRDGEARRGAVCALLRQRRCDPAVCRARRRVSDAHRRSRHRAPAVAAHRSGLALVRRLWRRRWRRLCRIPPAQCRWPCQPGLERFARCDLSCRWQSGGEPDRAVRGAGLCLRRQARGREDRRRPGTCRDGAPARRRSREAARKIRGGLLVRGALDLRACPRPQ